MIFEQLNPGACRTYLIGDEQSHQAILVDPVLEQVPEYLKILNQKKLKLTHASGASAGTVKEQHATPDLGCADAGGIHRRARTYCSSGKYPSDRPLTPVE